MITGLESYLPLGVALITFGGVVWANTSVLKNSLKSVDKELTGMRDELKKLSEVIVAQVAQSGRIDRIEDRQLMQGKRLDDACSDIKKLQNI